MCVCVSLCVCVQLRSADKSVEDLTRLVAKLRRVIDEKDTHLDSISNSLRSLQQGFDADEVARAAKEQELAKTIATMEQVWRDVM